MDDQRRLYEMRVQMEKVLDYVQPDVVCYEDYAIGKRFGGQRGIYSTAELGGVFKTLVWERGINLILVSPTSLKLVIAGDGRAEDLVAAIEETFGYIIKQHDEADAAGLMLLGEMKCGTNTFIPDARKSKRVESLRKCRMIRGRLKLIAKGG